MREVALRLEDDDYVAAVPVQDTEWPDVFTSPEAGEVLVQRAGGGVLVVSTNCVEQRR